MERCRNLCQRRSGDSGRSCCTLGTVSGEDDVSCVMLFAARNKSANPPLPQQQVIRAVTSLLLHMNEQPADRGACRTQLASTSRHCLGCAQCHGASPPSPDSSAENLTSSLVSEPETEPVSNSSEYGKVWTGLLQRHRLRVTGFRMAGLASLRNRNTLLASSSVAS